MNCYYHPDREVVGMCVSCGKPICAECKVVLGEKFYCNPCADKMFAGKAETAAPMAENTSGQGSSAIVTKEVQRWNWGAFFLSWIWAIGNTKVWIGLLIGLVTIFYVSLFNSFGFEWLSWIISLIIWIVFGVNGSKWAWQYKRWDSVEHFKRTQRTWTKWGVGLVVGSFVLGILAAIIIPNVARFIGRGQMEAAETELSNVQAAVVACMIDNGLRILPNPVTVATNDMSAFPDATSIAGGANKQYDPSGNAYRRGDKSGYILYQHDITGNGSSATMVNYVATQYTKGAYIVNTYGTVTQVTTGY